MTRIVRLGQYVLLAAVVAYGAVVVHDYARYCGYYPYLAIDDAVGNVAYSLATQGRYGFLASPVQGFTDLMRDRGFFNYGPWYFYVGAALIWLFGYSLTLLRAIHLAGILAIAATGCWWFGRRGHLAAGGLVAFGLLHSFSFGQWPMVRPDIAVSIFAVLFIVAAGRAIEDGSPVFWFLAGLGAGCAALTHLIAWALVPCCLVTLALALASERPGKRRAAIALLAVCLGLVAATAMFYASFGFRIRDHLETLAAYRTYLGGTTSAGGGRRAVLAEHSRIAFWYLSRYAQVALAAAVAANAGLLAAVWLFPIDMRRQILAVTLPPTAVLLFYGISLASYASHHTGYVILLQVAVWWCAGAALSASLSVVARRLPAWHVVAAAVAIVLVGASAGHLLIHSGSNPRLELTRRWVAIRDYLAKIDELIPAGATVWGTGIHGIDSPGHLELVEVVDGVNILRRSRKAYQVDSLAVSPEYLLWDYPVNRDNTLQALRGRGLPDDLSRHVFSRVVDLLRPVRYRVVGLIAAPPYGVTRVYERILNSMVAPPRLPAVSVFDIATQSWDERVEGPIATDFRPAAPVRLNVDYTPKEGMQADRTIAGDLPAGRYLLRVHVGRSSGALRPTIMCVTSVPSLTEAIGELGPTFDSSPYSSRDDEAYLVHDHGGGRVYLSQFDNGTGAAIEGVEVYRIQPMLHTDQRAERLIFRQMPPLPLWTPSIGVRRSTANSGALVVEGDASRMSYQLTSPRVLVNADTIVTLRATYEQAQGAVCIGALNGTATKWLANGGDPSRDFSFTVDATASFRMVFYNCNPSDNGNAPSRFTVAGVRYAESRPGLYVDRLLAIRDPKKAAASIVPDPRVRSFPAGLTVTSDEINHNEPPLRNGDLAFRAPIVKDAGEGWTITGKANAPYSYVLRWKRIEIEDPAARRDPPLWLMAFVRVNAGGATIGLLKNEQWAAQINLTTPGEFIVVIEPPSPGFYDVVVAHDIPDPSLKTDVVIAWMGWVIR